MYFPQLEVVGDVGNAIWRISEAIKTKPASWDLRCERSRHRGPDSPHGWPGSSILCTQLECNMQADC